MAKRTNPFWTILSVVLIVALVACGFAFKTEIKALFSGQKLYTKSQYDDAYNQGKKSGEAESKYNYELASGYKLELEKKKQELLKAQQDIEALKGDKNTLEDNVNQNNAAIENLNKQVNQLLEEIERLQNTIKAYDNGLNIMVGENEVAIKFMVLGELKAVKVITKNTSCADPYQVTFEEGCEFVFNGWKLGDETIDPTMYLFTDHVILVADITEYYRVTFAIGGTTYSSELVVSGNKPSAYPSPTGHENQYFRGYFVGGQKIDPATFVVTANTTIDIVYTDTATVTFKNGNTVHATQAVAKDQSITDPQTPTQTYNGKASRFNGWKLNGVIVNLADIDLTDDITLEADFSKLITIKVQAYNADYANSLMTKCFIERHKESTIYTIEVYEGEVINLNLNYYNSKNMHSGNNKCKYGCDFDVCVGATSSSINLSAGIVKIAIVDELTDTINPNLVNNTIEDNVTIATEDMNIAILTAYHNKRNV